ncbi:MAG: hypothetical protein SNJ71_05310, partial [Bacteroidales bacterium]
MKLTGGLLLVWLYISLQLSYSQDINSIEYNEYDSIMPNQLDVTFLNKCIFNEINNEKKLLKLPYFYENDVFNYAAHDYVQYMVENDINKAYQGGKKLSIERRMKQYGGSSQGVHEICLKVSIPQSRFTYYSFARDIIFVLFNYSTKEQICDYKYIFAGVASGKDSKNKRLYLCITMGNYNSLNKGASLTQNTTIPITKKKMGLKPYNPTVCKNISSIKNLSSLQAGLSLSGNKIFFDADIRILKKIIKENKDGIAVDLVFNEQFSLSNSLNIVDNSRFNKGYVVSKLYKNKLFNENILEGKEARNRFQGIVGEVPAGFKNFDMNLLLIQDKHVCMNIHKSYIEQSNVSRSVRAGILGDTLAIVNVEPKIQLDTTQLTFLIPFEQGKSTYKSSEIGPLLDKLNEPDFVIKQILITAYSSIEGNEETNVKLREDRATSIVDAMKSLQNKNIESTIITKDSWDLFYKDIKGTKFEFLSYKSPNAIREYIKFNKSPELEKILAKHRFAQVDMKIMYDISTAQKEQNYIVNMYKKAINANDNIEALKFQKIIMKKISAKLYDKNIIPDLYIKKEITENFAGIQMNVLWMDYYFNNKKIDEEFYNKVIDLEKKDKKNIYIKYNKIVAALELFPITTDAQILSLQSEVDWLKTSELPENYYVT